MTHTALVPRAYVERLINAAWAARVAHCIPADLAAELTEACNAARGALVADEIGINRVPLPPAYLAEIGESLNVVAEIRARYESNDAAIAAAAESLGYGRPEDLFNGS